jgi:hypothetical protein
MNHRGYRETQRKNILSSLCSSVSSVARAFIAAVIFILVCHAPVAAHEGPPFPLLMDKHLGQYVVSVWADPDVGTGTFFIVPELPQGGAFSNDVKVEVCVRPASGRLNEACYTAVRDDVGDRVQYQIAVPFDVQEQWQVRLVLQSSLGKAEANTNVLVTPPGLGRWELLLYLLPFIGAGFLWLMAFVRKQRNLKAAVVE